MGIELHTKFRIVHATLSLLCIIILGVLGMFIMTHWNWDFENYFCSLALTGWTESASYSASIWKPIRKIMTHKFCTSMIHEFWWIIKGTNTLPEDESLPWSFIAPLSLLIIGFLISLAFCIVRIVIRNRSKSGWPGQNQTNQVKLGSNQGQNWIFTNEKG